MISPHPLRLRMKRRKTVSVTPAIGASTVAGAISTGPIEKLEGKTLMRRYFQFYRVPKPFVFTRRPTQQEGFRVKGVRYRMKPSHIALLLAAGAGGGALV